jgi:hypothetical protein
MNFLKLVVKKDNPPPSSVPIIIAGKIMRVVVSHFSVVVVEFLIYSTADLHCSTFPMNQEFLWNHVIEETIVPCITCKAIPKPRLCNEKTKRLAANQKSLKCCSVQNPNLKPPIHVERY